MKKIRILLADDHAILRAGLRLLINTQPDMEVVGEAGDHDTALRTTIELQPDVLILDLSMPHGNSTSVIKEIARKVPVARVLVLTMHDDDTYFRVALAAGAFGYLVKEAADVELIDAIRAVSRGQVYARIRPSPDVPNVGPAEIRDNPQRKLIDTLSAREHEVLCFVAKGHTNQAVADYLSLSVKTIESYRARLTAKLGLQNRAQLTQFAVEMGLLRPGTSEYPE